MSKQREGDLRAVAFCYPDWQSAVPLRRQQGRERLSHGSPSRVAVPLAAFAQGISPQAVKDITADNVTPGWLQAEGRGVSRGRPGVVSAVRCMFRLNSQGFGFFTWPIVAQRGLGFEG
jgi:hypothetical protein